MSTTWSIFFRAIRTRATMTSCPFFISSSSLPFIMHTLQTCMTILFLSMRTRNCESFVTKTPNRREQISDTLTAILPSPTKDDLALEEWYLKQGIRGIERVKVITTSKSVAGRGLFYSCERPAQQGDFLALIPCECVLTKENAQRKWPDLIRNENVDYDWPVALTLCAERALKEDDAAWSSWIETWQGPGAPRRPESFDGSELEDLARKARSSPDEIKRALQVRFDVFEKHSSRFEYPDLYGVVLSRAANLGGVWNNQSAIIPLHDMLNHPPLTKEPNVELFTVKDIASLTSNEYVEQQARAAFPSCSRELKDRDLVLVARETIHAGDELFLLYAKRQLTEKERVWKMLQYGIPLV